MHSVRKNSRCDIAKICSDIRQKCDVCMCKSFDSEVIRMALYDALDLEMVCALGLHIEEGWINYYE